MSENCWKCAQAKVGGTPCDLHANALPPVRVEADVRQVAAFRLPVSVKSLAAMVDGLTREYGKGLTMRQVGDSLIIEQPNARLDAGREKGSP